MSSRKREKNSGAAPVVKQELPDAQGTVISCGLLAVILFCGINVLADHVSGPMVVIAGGLLSSLIFLFTYLAIGNTYILVWGDYTPATWSVVIVAYILAQLPALSIAPQASIICTGASGLWLYYLVTAASNIYKS
ncbi:Protein KRTCAP2-like protein [Diplonema papillatum]|nr:Protein KRTCAP2-like protein [Diplonema papillatum]